MNGFRNTTVEQDYQHDNFNGQRTKLRHSLPGPLEGVVPSSEVLDPNGVSIGTVQFKPGDGGGWEVDVIKNSPQFTINIVDNT